MAKIDLYWPQIQAILHGDGARSATKRIGNQLAQKWRRNIHRVTGVTRTLITTETPGGFSGSRTYILTGEAGPTKNQTLNLSAELWLEFGTAKMNAKAPGRKALGEMAAE